MKKLLLIPVLFLSFIMVSCSSDDDSGGNSNSTVKFEAIVSQNRDSQIVTLIDSSSDTATNPTFPFTKVYSDVSITSGKTLQINFLDMTNVPVGATFSYTVQLKITIGNNEVKSQTFNVNETTTAPISINYVVP
ncbi:hypothetical protein M0G43_13105 [Subsaxibacter sp. CAU 1640]|uniref:hypothetical protein n=1 Tax=Subsaxibacter sp. CAU 1640 TaxID=2933271 RepID=UPI0020033174|nr:hypothetical protein [Subsaxibacter sp. CAU 1640]MCK7591518.1 hypothetical protein [Subsaxibacter sp. CAU 1640]